MEYQIKLKRFWRWMPSLKPGILNVPEDIDQRNASRAVSSGYAEKIKLVSVLEPSRETPIEEQKPKRKKKSPKNKALRAAPENKSSLD